jgi:hypothetical protein
MQESTDNDNAESGDRLPENSGPPSSEVTSEVAKLREAKRIKLIPEGVNQADVDAVLKRLSLMRKRLREDILFVGGRLAKMRDKITYGSWTTFVARTFPLSVKTANIWIRAYENRESELAVKDWDAYMRVLYGNDESRKLKAPQEHRQEEKEKPSEKQHGGPGFNPSFFDDEENPGKLLIADFEEWVSGFDREIFENLAVTPEEKLRFIAKLIRWLEIWRTKIAARAEEAAPE